ncbi:MAG: sensor histidine kinase [Planctomycetota bacterium]|jgi:signal transduction histidine kinase
MNGARRRGILRRPVLLFGLLLLFPAVGFALLGWRSVVRERDVQAMEASTEARDLLDRRVLDTARELEAIRTVEAERPYFAYQAQYLPEGMLYQNLGFQETPLARTPEDARVRGWFQWERGMKGARDLPEVFGADAETWKDAFVSSYGPAFRERLERVTGDVPLRAGRRVDHSLLVVAANEERGQLLEEVQVLQQGAGQLPLERSGQSAATAYLRNFYGRVGDVPAQVPVRYGAFQYLAREPDAAGPPIVAWRYVWVPAAHAERRETERDRWLIQGYARDAGAALPTVWESVGRARVRRGDTVAAGAGDGMSLVSLPGARSASLADALGAEQLSPLPGVAGVDASLVLVAVSDHAQLDASFREERARFLWLVAGMLVVVGVGFLVLTRGVRREVALARRKEDFVAAVTHELKTPLTGIRMHADMLREGWVNDPDQARAYAKRILDESDRLGHLVDQVLDLAALERGVARVAAVPGDLGEAVREAAAIVEARAADAGIDLVVEVDEGLPSVPFDPRLLRPLVLNLLDNAIKYSERSPRKDVRVSLRHEGERAVLQVADRGVGIPPSVRRHLFEPFRRAGDELTRSAPGIGIGLALVKRYADAHDARVSLESAEGEGTTVTVRFPL